MFPVSCPLNVPINCTDSCKQVSCVCCSSNVSVRTWEKRTVRYNEAENELHDEPKPNAIIAFLQQLCCSNNELETQKRMQACEAISIFLMHNYEVELAEAAKNSGIDIEALQQGRRPMELSHFQSLKRAAAEIYQRKSGSSASNASQSGHHNTPVEKFSIPKRTMTRYQATVWKKPPSAGESVA